MANFHFSPLPYSRLTGTERKQDGQTVYTYTVSVSDELPPITLTLTVSAAPSVEAQAHFDHASPQQQREGGTSCLSSIERCH